MGGSRTVALLASSVPKLTDSFRTTVLGRGEAGPSNLQAVGSALRGALQEAVAGAFAAAKLTPMPVTAVSLGLAVPAGRKTSKSFETGAVRCT